MLIKGGDVSTAISYCIIIIIIIMGNHYHENKIMGN